MEIEEQHVDEGFALFQAKAENMMQKRQKLIDGKTKSPLLRQEFLIVADLSSNLEKIFHVYLETFTTNFQTRSDELSQLLSAYNEEAV
jgi:hypothetical protein